jgi:hypothetical protein
VKRAAYPSYIAELATPNGDVTLTQP